MNVWSLQDFERPTAELGSGAAALLAVPAEPARRTTVVMTALEAASATEAETSAIDWCNRSRDFEKELDHQ